MRVDCAWALQEEELQTETDEESSSDEGDELDPMEAEAEAGAGSLPVRRCARITPRIAHHADATRTRSLKA